jgi:hypothetical protein
MTELKIVFAHCVSYSCPVGAELEAAATAVRAHCKVPIAYYWPG